MNNPTITLAEYEYEKLLAIERWNDALDTLDAAGVDNWCDFDEACAILREIERETD